MSMAKIDSLGESYFRAIAMAGHFHMLDIADYGFWDPKRIAVQSEREVDLILTRIEHNIVRTVDELNAALIDSRERPGSLNLYIHERLLDEVKVRWGQTRKALGKAAVRAEG